MLHLKNGDRLTGTISSEDTNRVILVTSWAKEVMVPLTEISKREIVAAPAPPAPAKVEAKPAETKPVAQAAAPKPPPAPVKPKPPKRWAGDLEVGAALVYSEKDQKLYNARVRLTYTHDHFRNTVDYLASYGKTEDVITANRMDGSSKTDFDLGKRIYVYNLIGAGYDEIRKIDLRYEFGPGVGYHLLKFTNFVLNTEAGLSYLSEHFSDGNVRESMHYRLAESATWSLGKRLTVDEKFEFFPRVENWGRYRFRFEGNLRFWLQQNMWLSFSVLDQYDTQPANNVQQNDLQLRTTIGMKF